MRLPHQEELKVGGSGMEGQAELVLEQGIEAAEFIPGRFPSEVRRGTIFWRDFEAQFAVGRRCSMTFRVGLTAVSAAVLLAIPLLVPAQSQMPPAQTGAPVADPVSTAFKTTMKTYESRIVAAADEMPADKYSFQPSKDQMPFGQLIWHIATTNEPLCQAIGGVPAAPATTATATSSKDDLMNLLKSAFSYCEDSFANLNDSQLGAMVGGGRRQTSRAAAMFTLTNDLADHYSQQAAYLRANGLLPPTAQGRGRGM